MPKKLQTYSPPRLARYPPNQMRNIRRATSQSPTSQQDRSKNGKLKLLISGFSQQRVITIDDIVAAIACVPEFHLEGLNAISYLPGSAYRPTQRKAEFNQRKRQILFYELVSREAFRHILYHEIGHYVFFLVIGSRVKKEWVTKIYPGSNCATLYGTQSASEDFAESYACYVNDPGCLEQLPEKHAFMRDKIFSGRPETLKEKNQQFPP